MRARLLRPDGSTESCELPQDTGQAHYYIGKYLSTNSPAPLILVRQKDGQPGLTLWHNAASFYSNIMAANVPATLLALDLTDWALAEYIVGEVVLTGCLDSSGEVSGLTPDQDIVLAEMAVRWAQPVGA